MIDPETGHSVPVSSNVSIFDDYRPNDELPVHSAVHRPNPPYQPYDCIDRLKRRGLQGDFSLDVGQGDNIELISDLDLDVSQLEPLELAEAFSEPVESVEAIPGDEDYEGEGLDDEAQQRMSLRKRAQAAATMTLPLEQISQVIRNTAPKFHEGENPPEAPPTEPRLVYDGVPSERGKGPQLVNALRRAKLLQSYDGTDVDDDTDEFGEAAQQAFEGKILPPEEEFQFSGMGSAMDDMTNTDTGRYIAVVTTPIKEDAMKPEETKPTDAQATEKSTLNYLKSVEGRVLTVLEAALPDKEHRQAVKTLIKKEFRRTMNQVNRIQVPSEDED